MQVTLTATNGTLTLSGIDGPDFEFEADSVGAPQGMGTVDVVMMFRGDGGNGENTRRTLLPMRMYAWSSNRRPQYASLRLDR